MISMLKTVLLSVAVLSPAVGHADEKPELYEHGPDSVRHAGVPRGEVTKHEWRSKIYENTVRDYWVYVPAQYDGETPACLMVFQDGHLYVNRFELDLPVRRQDARRLESQRESRIVFHSRWHHCR